MDVIGSGLARSFRGLRTGNQRLVYTGAALIVVGLWRRNRQSRKLVYRGSLREGKQITIRYQRPSRTA